MLMIYDWLKSHTSFTKELNSEQIRQLFTFHSFEIDGVHDLQASLEHVIVGQIQNIQAHPKADKLKLCQVFDGQQSQQVVCGGSNLKENQLVAYCQVGAKVKWHGSEEVTIHNTEIRGEKSHGMIAASDEIGLGESQGAEILDLSQFNLKPGDPLHQALQLPKIILDIDNKSITNRPDLWSTIGLARELSAITDTEFSDIQSPDFLSENTSSETLNIQVQNPEILQRLCFLKISNLKVCDSPIAIQTKLNMCGIKSINNIVDATNYILLELGQPMHAYDTSKIKLDDIQICFAKNKEAFSALDHKEYELQSFDPILRSNKQAQCLLGMIGGSHSAVDANTKEILLELGCFQFDIIRKSSNFHKIRTEGVQRQEKQIDPSQAHRTLNRFIKILKLSCPNLLLSSQLHDTYPNPLIEKTLKLSVKKVNGYLGIQLNPKEIINILNNLGFETENLGENILVKIPNFRAQNDVNFDYDLIEEIGRIHGYNKIPAILPIDTCQAPMQYKKRSLTHKVRQMLARNGYYEAINYSFVNSDDIQHSQQENLALKMQNYLSSEQAYLRTSLIPGLLKNLHLNLKHQEQVCLFEVGRVYFKSKDFFPSEEKHLGIIKNGANSFLEVKGIAELLCEENNLAYEFLPCKVPAPNAHPKACADLIVQGKTIGQIYKLHPDIIHQYDLANQNLSYLEINFGIFAHLDFQVVQHQTISKYPSINFDLSIVLDQHSYHQDVVKCLQSASPLIQKIELFDIYQGSNLAGNKKALAYSITIQDANNTLSSQDLEDVQQACSKALESIKATIRSS